MLGKGLALHQADLLDDRPAGTVRVWRRTGEGWTLARKPREPVRVQDIRQVPRSRNELIEFVPLRGRGSPLIVASPALLDAWNEATPAD